jgi:hypothetical protein
MERANSLISSLSQVNQSYGAAQPAGQQHIHINQNETTSVDGQRAHKAKTHEIVVLARVLIDDESIDVGTKERLASQVHAYIAHRHEARGIFKNMGNAIARVFKGTNTALEVVNEKACSDVVVTNKDEALAFLQDQQDGACAMWQEGDGYKVLYKMPGQKPADWPEIPRSTADAHNLSVDDHLELVDRETRDAAVTAYGNVDITFEYPCYIPFAQGVSIVDQLKGREVGSFVLLRPQRGSRGDRIAMRISDGTIRIFDIAQPGEGPKNYLKQLSRALEGAEQYREDLRAFQEGWSEYLGEGVKVHASQVDAYNAPADADAPYFHVTPRVEWETRYQRWNCKTAEGTMWQINVADNLRAVTTVQRIPGSRIAPPGYLDFNNPNVPQGSRGINDRTYTYIFQAQIRRWISYKNTFRGQLQTLEGQGRVVKGIEQIPSGAQRGTYFVARGRQLKLHVVNGYNQQTGRPDTTEYTLDPKQPLFPQIEQHLASFRSVEEV